VHDAAVTIIAPTLAAFVTGAVLIFQNHLNARREDRRLAGLRAGERDKEIQAARSDWAAACQDALVQAMASIKAWEHAALGPPFIDRSLGAYDAWLLAFRSAQVATARLWVVEQDHWVRSTTSSIALAIEPATKLGAVDERGAVAKSESDRLTKIYSAFVVFTRLLAGVGTVEDHDKLVKDLGDGLSPALPSDARAKILQRASKKSAFGRA
jgi:hypothetical protein